MPIKKSEYVQEIANKSLFYERDMNQNGAMGVGKLICSV